MENPSPTTIYTRKVIFSVTNTSANEGERWVCPEEDYDQAGIHFELLSFFRLNRLANLPMSFSR
jgi:hypothetical protein